MVWSPDRCTHLDRDEAAPLSVVHPEHVAQVLRPLPGWVGHLAADHGHQRLEVYLSSCTPRVGKLGGQVCIVLCRLIVTSLGIYRPLTLMYM